MLYPRCCECNARAIVDAGEWAGLLCQRCADKRDAALREWVAAIERDEATIVASGGPWDDPTTLKEGCDG